jgi:hypothetical protein
LHNLYLGLGSFLSAISRATLPGLPVLASGFGWAATRSSLLTVSQVVPYATCQPGWHRQDLGDGKEVVARIFEGKHRKHVVAQNFVCFNGLEPW